MALFRSIAEAPCPTVIRGRGDARRAEAAPAGGER